MYWMSWMLGTADEKAQFRIFRSVIYDADVLFPAYPVRLHQETLVTGY